MSFIVCHLLFIHSITSVCDSVLWDPIIHGIWWLLSSFIRVIVIVESFCDIYLMFYTSIDTVSLKQYTGA